MDTEAHNTEVAELWQAFGRNENDRVPITFATDEAVWLDLTGNSFLEFHEDAAAAHATRPAV